MLGFFMLADLTTAVRLVNFRGEAGGLVSSTGVLAGEPGGCTVWLDRLEGEPGLFIAEPVVLSSLDLDGRLILGMVVAVAVGCCCCCCC